MTSDYHAYSAQELGLLLRCVGFSVPTRENLKKMGDATLGWVIVHLELDDVQKEFFRAQSEWQENTSTEAFEDLWRAVVLSASELGDKLRKYGSETLEKCERPRPDGPPCMAQRLTDGTCSKGPDAHSIGT